MKTIRIRRVIGRDACVSKGQGCRVGRSSRPGEQQQFGAVRISSSTNRKRFCYPFGISTILPITPPLPSNSCACRASQRGNRCAISGLIFFCCNRSNSVSRS